MIPNFEQIINDYKNNGISLINNYLKDSSELHDLKNKLYNLTCIKANQYSLSIPQNSNDEIDSSIMELNSLNNKIGAFFNDTINASPELYRLFTSKKIEDLAINVLKIERDCLLSNNYRFRIQIPGRDEVSNLPWHQDSHYNNLYNHNQSVVIWVSLSDIDKELGPIVYKKGSHKIGRVPIKDYKRKNKNMIYTVDDKYINDSDYEDCSISTKSGDVFLIDMNLIHRSGYNRSKNRLKLSLQGRFHNGGASGLLSQYF